MRENLRTNFLGVEMPNPFMLASAPPARDRDMIDRAFQAGWGGAVIKTLTQYTGEEGSEIRDVSPRIFPIRGSGGVFKNVVFGYMNIELTSQKTNEESCEDISFLKKRWPDRAVIASILYGHAPIQQKWQRAAADCELAGADAIELNFSCPHGCSEIGSGVSIGGNPAKIREIIGWVKEATRLPLITKLTALSDIVYAAALSEECGADAICAINTISSMPGIDHETFRPRMNAGGVGTAGGLSGHMIKPIALRSVLEIARAVKIPVSGSGGIYDWREAAEFILAGASTLQICSAVMEQGYGIIGGLCNGLSAYMERMGFKDIDAFRGRALGSIVHHADIDRGRLFKPYLDIMKCSCCGKCAVSCRDAGYQAITLSRGGVRIELERCTGCGLCYGLCPNEALTPVETRV